MSRYSAQDLACILGTRASTKNNSNENTASESEEIEEPALESEVEHSHGVVTIRKGNINDYFASKMAAMRQKLNLPEQGDFDEIRHETMNDFN